MLRRRAPGGKVPRAQGGATQTHYLDAIARVPVVDAVRALATLSRHAARTSTSSSAAAFASGIGPLAAAGPRPALRDALCSAAGSPEAFLASRRRYAASLAASTSGEMSTTPSVTRAFVPPANGYLCRSVLPSARSMT